MSTERFAGVHDCFEFEIGTIIRGGDECLYEVVEHMNSRKWRKYCYGEEIRSTIVYSCDLKKELIEYTHVKTAAMHSPIYIHKTERIDDNATSTLKDTIIESHPPSTKIKKRGRPPKPVVGVKKPRKPRAPTAYNLFMKENLPKLAKANPGLKSNEYMLMCSALWETYKSSSSVCK